MKWISAVLVTSFFSVYSISIPAGHDAAHASAQHKNAERSRAISYTLLALDIESLIYALEHDLPVNSTVAGGLHKNSAEWAVASAYEKYQGSIRLLPNIYMYGIGVKKDLVEAIAWMYIGSTVLAGADKHEAKAALNAVSENGNWPFEDAGVERGKAILTLL